MKKPQKGSQDIPQRSPSHKMLEEWAYSESNARGCPGIRKIFSAFYDSILCLFRYVKEIETKTCFHAIITNNMFSANPLSNLALSLTLDEYFLQHISWMHFMYFVLDIILIFPKALGKR